VVVLKLRSDTWSNDRSVLPFLKSVESPQLGPDGARLEFTLKLVKPEKGTAFLRTAWQLELETKVRSLVVARWVLDRVSEVSELPAVEGTGKKLDDIGLALRIESATKHLGKGPVAEAEA
jgi:hypothetical protein